MFSPRGPLPPSLRLIESQGADEYKVVLDDIYNEANLRGVS